MQFSKNLYRFLLPNGFEIVESVNTQGRSQTSLSFPFGYLFKPNGLRFADRLNNLIKRVEP